jgi:hypothetical protein
MTRALVVIGAVLGLAAFGPAAVVEAQPPQPQRVIGDQLSGQMQWNPTAQKTTDMATCTFRGSSDGLLVTIDFVTQYAGQRPTTPPTVVDMVVTQHPPNEDAPEMALSIDGRSLPLNTRLRSRRSVVATMSFDEFVRLANADAIVERAFDVDLEFGPGQRRMLRSVADRWSGGIRR